MRIKLLLAVIAVTLIVIVGTVSATPRLYIEDRLVVPGSEVKIPVMVENAQDLANMDLTVHWIFGGTAGSQTDGLLTVKQVEKGSLNQKSLFEYNNADAGDVKISFASTSGMSGSGSIAVLTCQVTNDPRLFGDSNIFDLSIVASAAQTSSGAPVVFDTSNGKIEFGTSALRGDCDGDGRITTNDAQMALQMAAGKLGQNTICNLNDDNSVDPSDIREILKLSQSGRLPLAVAPLTGLQPEGVSGGASLRAGVYRTVSSTPTPRPMMTVSLTRTVPPKGITTRPTYPTVVPAYMRPPVLNDPTQFNPGYIRLTWDYIWPDIPSSYQDGYELERSVTSANSGFSIIYNTVGTNDHRAHVLYWFSYATVPTTWFRVRARNANGYTSYSNVVSISTPQIVRYGITVVTSEGEGAGTNGDVDIAIVGENAIIIPGSSCYSVTDPSHPDCLRLRLDNLKNNFERGNVDNFTIMTNDIGEIQKMSLTFWAEDEHDNWACKEVYIKNEMTNKAWIFLVIRGFDSWSYLNPPIFQATQWDPNNIPSPT